MPLVVKKNQELDMEGLKSNIAAYEEAGFHGYMAFGCMGEFYATTLDEFKRIVDTAVDATRKIACVFGATYHNTAECVTRAKYAEDAGADGVMVGLPYLIPCTADAAFEHFRRINDAVDDVQIMVYNNPFSFRFNITAELWDRLMTLDRVTAVKESNGEAFHRLRVISHISGRINVFSGSEPLLLGDSLVGGNSIISVAGTGSPRAALALYDACLARNLEIAIPLTVAFANLFKDITNENEVAWLKACAELGGIKAGPPRAPYSPLDAVTRRGIADGLARLEELVDEISGRRTRARKATGFSQGSNPKLP
jgi:4-hydroxy-tetrahydrodipicolinate synthase